MYMYMYLDISVVQAAVRLPGTVVLLPLPLYLYTTRQYGNMTVWQYGNMSLEIWEFESMSTWEYRQVTHNSGSLFLSGNDRLNFKYPCGERDGK